MITTDHAVFRQDWIFRGREVAPYCEDQGVRYILFKRYYLWGWQFWSREVDREELPPHVWISQAIFGNSSGWESKFKEYMK